MEPEETDRQVLPPQPSARGGHWPDVLFWSRKLARLILLGSGIYMTFLLLALTSQRSREPAHLRLDPVVIGLGPVKVSGSARPGAPVEVLAGERPLGMALTDWKGRFAIEVYPPPEAPSLWVRAFASPKDATPVETDRTVPVRIVRTPGPPPKLSLAYFIEEPRKLWVAGSGSPGTWIALTSRGREISVVHVQENGCFDSLFPIPADREPPPDLSPGGGEALAVTRAQAEALPLARSADLDLGSSESHLALRIELPAAHPYYVLLEKGFMAATEFSAALFGQSDLQGEVKVTALRKSGSAAVVELEQSGSGMPPVLVWHGGAGVGETPLLTAKDRIRINFHGISPAWFGDPAPTSIDGNTALWQGPRDGWQALEIGFRLPDLVRSYAELNPARPAGKKTEEEKFRDIVSDIGVQGSANLRLAWRRAILLIPFAWLIWLAFKRPFGPPEHWRMLTATALVLALWRIFVAFVPLMTWAGSVLVRIPIPVEAFDFARPWALADEAFWIPFAVVAATLPRLWRHLFATQLQPHAVLGPRRSGVRRIAFGLRVALFLLASLAGISVVSGYFRPHEFLAVPGNVPAIVMDQAFLLLCLGLALLAFGLRAFLMGAGFALLILSRLVQKLPPAEVARSGALDALVRLPRGPVIAVTVLACCPFLYFLVRRLTGAFLGRRQAWLLTAVLAVAALLLPWLPDRAWLSVGGGLLLFGFGGIVLGHLESAMAQKPWARAISEWPRLTRGILFLLSVLLAWPLAGSATALEHWQLANLDAQIEELFIYCLALGLVLLLREHARRSPSPIVDRATLGVAIYLFAVLLINGYGLWLLLPVPFLIGVLVASSWLFRPEAEVQRLRTIAADKLRRLRRLIQDTVDASASGNQFSAIQKSLLEKLRKAELTPEEYEEKLETCRKYLEKKLELETVAPGVQSQEAVFAVGGPALWDNVSASVKTGAVLAAGPLLIALYQFLPQSREGYAFPLVTLLGFIVWAVARWLLYAFFFGFYFSYLRGKSGLVKGIYLCAGLLLPFAVYRLLYVQTLTDMRPFFFWAAQLFLFCSLLGLLAIDYRLLRNHGFRVRDLTAVHNAPALSAYVSTALAALIPTVIALITGKFGDLVKFFLDMVMGIPSHS